MKKPPPARFLQRADAFCARLNTGLAAVALVLRLPTMLPPQPAFDDLAVGDR